MLCDRLTESEQINYQRKKMAEFESNVVTDGSDVGEFSDGAIEVITILPEANIEYPTDYSNTILVQNQNNASVVSIFSLEGNKPQAMEQNQSISVDFPPTSVPTNTGGSAY